MKILVCMFAVVLFPSVEVNACFASNLHQAAEILKSPIPPQDDIESSRASIVSIYKKKYEDRTTDGKRNLARFLLETASEQSGAGSLKYALADEARKKSLESSDFRIAWQSIDMLEAAYSMGAATVRELRVDAVCKIGVKALPDSCHEIASTSIGMIEECFREKDYSAAERLIKCAHAAVQACGDEVALDRWKVLQFRSNEYKKTRVERQRLEVDPDDPAANLVVGKQECFRLDEWDAGLIKLAKAGDQQLSELARLEMCKPIAVASQLDLADKWCEFAGSQAGSDKRAVLAHAGVLYREVLPWLPEGIERLRVSGALEVIESDITVVGVGAKGPRGPGDASPQVSGQASSSSGANTKYRWYSNRKGAMTSSVVTSALDWLKRHQSSNGYWSCGSFGTACVAEKCSGDGDASHDVGVTGLALLAFLGAGQTHAFGSYREEVKAALDYLKELQESTSGRFGEDTGSQGAIYDQAIASLAICEAYALTQDPTIKETAQRAVLYCQSARNSNKAWRYTIPPNGENDLSVTGWMIMVLITAKHSGLNVDDDAFADSERFIDSLTDPDTGRTGYMSRGGRGAREPGMSERWPVERVEPMTASAMVSRVFIGQLQTGFKLSTLGVSVLKESMPAWDEMSGTIDYYYWFWGTMAMFQHGGSHWSSWSQKLKKAIEKTQERSGCLKGSWNPSYDPWGARGGRVYSTAMLCLCAEAEWRFLRFSK